MLQLLLLAGSITSLLAQGCVSPARECTCTYTGPDSTRSVLDCSSKGLTEVPKFEPKMNFNTIDLRNNNIRTIQLGAFSNIITTELLLRGNQIEETDETALDGIKQIELEGPTPAVLLEDLDLTMLPQLTHLTLINYEIEYLSSSLWKESENLKELTLESCMLAGLEGYPFQDTLILDKFAVKSAKNNGGLVLSNFAVPNLHELSFENTRLRTLTSRSFGKMSLLATLTMQGTGMTTLPENVLDSLPNIRTLDISQNAFTGPLVLTSRSLSTLVMNNCGLTELPSLDKLRGLSSLDASSNLFTSLALLPKNISRVNFKHNEIVKLNGALADLPKLEKVDLGFNKLVGISATAFRDSSNILRTLDLNNNRLERLHLCSLYKFTSLEKVDLTGNSQWFECDCHVSTLLHLALERNVAVLGDCRSGGKITETGSLPCDQPIHCDQLLATTTAPDTAHGHESDMVFTKVEKTETTVYIEVQVADHAPQFEWVKLTLREPGSDTAAYTSNPLALVEGALSYTFTGLSSDTKYLACALVKSRDVDEPVEKEGCVEVQTEAGSSVIGGVVAGVVVVIVVIIIIVLGLVYWRHRKNNDPFANIGKEPQISFTRESKRYNKRGGSNSSSMTNMSVAVMPHGNSYPVFDDQRWSSGSNHTVMTQMTDVTMHTGQNGFGYQSHRPPLPPQPLAPTDDEIYEDLHNSPTIEEDTYEDPNVNRNGGGELYLSPAHLDTRREPPPVPTRSTQNDYNTRRPSQEHAL